MNDQSRNPSTRPTSRWLGTIVFACCSALGLATFGCAETAQDEGAPVAEDDGLGERLAGLTNGGWYVEAKTPNVAPYYKIQARAWVQRNTTPDKRMVGVCLMEEGRTSTNQIKTCSTAADCTNAPSTLPSGGARYCAKAENETVKRCWFRASNALSCAGSPATHAPVDLTPPAVATTLATPYKISYDTSIKFISYACFEGCLASDPAISSAAASTMVYDGTSSSGGGGHPRCEMCGSVCC